MAEARPSPRTVAFIASAYLGHFYPTLELARALSRTGLPVIYLLIESSDEIKAAISGEGFAWQEIATLGELKSLGRLIARGERHAARFRLQDLVAQFARVAKARGIGLVLVDNYVRFFGALATFNGIPAVTACFNYAENVRRSRLVEPRDLERVDDRTEAGIMHVLRQWAATPGLLIDRCRGVQRDIERFAAARGLDTEYFIYNRFRLFKYPVFYFAPRELVRPNELAGRFLGLCVTGRQGRGRGAYRHTDVHQPIVYVSLGTVDGYLEQRRRFFAAIVDAFRERRDLHVIVHVSIHIDPRDVGPVPEHIEVHQTVPQLEVIERASLAITHGGLGAVKECIYFATPMLVYPLLTEELENARRMVAHGVGGLGGLMSTPAHEIRRQALEMIGDERFVHRARHLKAAIERDDPCARGVETLTRILSDGCRPGEGQHALPETTGVAARA